MTIAALGGWPKPPMVDFLLGLTDAERPRALFIPTAAGDADWAIESFDAAFGGRSDPSHLLLFQTPADDPRRVLDADIVYVQGGNTASMLAVWRVHGLDRILREAWDAGVVLAGHSAGAICWFEAGVTDSFSAELDGLDCLGFLPGSCCPHYDGEEQRRPAFHRLVAAGFPAGLAVDDDCAFVFRGTELVEAVAASPDARAYRVELRGGEVVETALEARRLP